jgi:hypothetical protein
MLKNNRQSVSSSVKYSTHEQEMAKLREHHERVMKDSALREATLVGAGVFVRTTEGKLAVAKPYDKVIVPMRTS